MDFSKLSKGEKLVGLGAIAGIIAGLLPWYSWKVELGILGSTGGSVSGFTSWWSLSGIASILALLMIVLPMFKVKLPKLGLENKAIYMILGLVTGGIPLLALLGIGSGSFSYKGTGAGVSFGVFVAIAAGVIMIIGANMEKKV